jgi:hypothetical protein
VLPRQAQRRGAEHALHAVGRPQEAGGAVGDQHVLQRRLVALLVVAVQQLGGRAALQHGGQLPGQVVGVGDAGVAAAGAERADHLGRIAHQEQAAVPHRVDAFAAVGVRADPDDLDLAVGAELARQALAHHVFAADVLGVGVGRHLVVDAPDVVAHQVLPDGAVLVERRLDPGVALHRRLPGEAHVGDAPAVVALARRDAGAHPLAERAVAAGGVDHVVGGRR